MFAILGADSYEIFTAFIIVPLGTGRRYTIDSFEFIIRHNRWILNTIFTFVTWKNDFYCICCNALYYLTCYIAHGRDATFCVCSSVNVEYCGFAGRDAMHCVSTAGRRTTFLYIPLNHPLHLRHQSDTFSSSYIVSVSGEYIIINQRAEVAYWINFF